MTLVPLGIVTRLARCRVRLRRKRINYMTRIHFQSLRTDFFSLRCIIWYMVVATDGQGKLWQSERADTCIASCPLYEVVVV